jgi:hypothetical protein
MHVIEALRVGQRVRYVGTVLARLSNATGTVTRVDRRGWIAVDFGGTFGECRCSQSSLKPLA